MIKVPKDIILNKWIVDGIKKQWTKLANFIERLESGDLSNNYIQTKKDLFKEFLNSFTTYFRIVDEINLEIDKGCELIEKRRKFPNMQEEICFKSKYICFLERFNRLLKETYYLEIPIHKKIIWERFCVLMNIIPPKLEFAPFEKMKELSNLSDSEISNKIQEIIGNIIREKYKS